MSKIHYYRVQTGEWDQHGEKCLLFMGGKAKTKGGITILVSPKGDEVFSAETKKISKLTRREVEESVRNEIRLAKETKAGPKN